MTLDSKHPNLKSFTKQKRDQWDSFEYNTWFKNSKGRIIDKLEKHSLLKALKGKRYTKCLDVGVGNGRQILVYHNFIDELLAIDISQGQLNAAKLFSSKFPIKSRFELCDDASKLNCNDNSFDLIICTRVLQHVYDWKSAISEFHRVLRPGGDLILITYNSFSIYGILKLIENRLFDSSKGNFRNPVGLIRVLREKNFEIEYYSGGLIGQPSIFPNSWFTYLRNLVLFMERLETSIFFKYFGERQIVRSKKHQ